jgi:hypothetical protein
MKYIQLRNIFHTKYNKHFKINNDYIYSIEEYITILENENFLDYFNNLTEAEQYILQDNNVLYDKYYKDKNLNIYYKVEQDLIKDKKVFTCRNNNFIEYLTIDDKENYKFYHKNKKILNRKIS